MKVCMIEKVLGTEKGAVPGAERGVGTVEGEETESE